MGGIVDKKERREKGGRAENGQLEGEKEEK